MLDECTITAQAVPATFDPATGETTVSAGAEVYAGKCKVQARALVPSTPEVGGQLLEVVSIEVHVPVTVDGLERGQEVVISAAAADPQLVGRRFLITTVPVKSFATARRLRCEETTT